MLTKHPLLICLLTLFTSLSAMAQTTWTGTIDDDWHKAGNWSAGVPGQHTNVVIPPTATNDPNLGTIDGFCADLDVQAGATLTIPGIPTLFVSGNATATGAIQGDGNSEGEVVFSGVGITITGIFTNVTIEGTATFVGVTQIGVGSDPNDPNFKFGDLRHEALAGPLTFAASSRVEVSASARFLGERVIGLAGSTLDVGPGGTTQFDTALDTTDPPPNLFIGGGWTAGSTFVPNAGVQLVFNSPTSQFVGGSGLTVPSMRVDGGDVTLSLSTLNVNDLEINGLLKVNAGFQDVTVEDELRVNGTLIIAGTNTSFRVRSGDIINNGSVSGPIPITTAPPTGEVLRLTGSGTYESAIVDGGGTVEVDGDVTSDFVNVLRGTLSITPGSTLDVTFDFSFETADVDLNGTLQVGRDFVADDSFDARPDTGTVSFIGDGTLQGTGASSTLGFSEIVVTGGQRVVVGNLNLNSEVLTVDTDGELLVDNDNLGVTCSGTTVRGQFTLLNSGSVSFDPDSTFVVEPDGILVLNGVFGDPATFSGPNNGSSPIQLNGTLEASFFVFEDLPPAGVVIGTSASFAAAPDDFRDGTFRNGSNASGSTLLSIDRSSTTTLTNITFENLTGATFNVSAPDTSATINFVNFDGAFSGPAFENDPGDNIEWLGIAPTVWTGSVSNSWTVEGNWSDGVPDQNTPATIPSTGTNPDLFTGDAQCLSLTIDAGASLNVGSGRTLAAYGDVNAQGSMTGLGKLSLQGPRSRTFFGNAIDVELEGSGEVTMNTATVESLTQLGSASPIAQDIGVNVQVTGSLGIFGPGFADGNGSYDVGGSITLTPSTQVTLTPTLIANGSWTSNNQFVPSAGEIRFAGADQSISSATPLFDVAIAPGGTRTMPSGLQINGTLMVENGGTVNLAAGGTFSLGDVDVAGALVLEQGATVQISNGCNVNIQPVGALSLLGTASEPVFWNGPAGAGDSLVLEGTLEAQHYGFQNLPPDGVQITSNASFAAAPRDFRNGTFTLGSTEPNSTLLTIEQSSTFALETINFFNPSNRATFNVRVPDTSATIEIRNFAGDFAGAAFEDDSGNNLNWFGTVLTSYQVAGLTNGAELTFVTASEFEVARFVILRSTSGGSGFSPIAASPVTPAGSPTSGATYVVQDTGLTPGVTYFYRLTKENPSNVRSFLAQRSVQPLPSSFGDVVVVGPGGFADIDAALTAMPTGGTVLVETGSYPSFTVDKDARIIARDGAAVSIDAGTSRVRVENLAAADSVSLYGIDITPGGLDVVNCDGQVVLDRLNIAEGMGGIAVDVDDSPQVKLQDCSLAGSTALRVQNGSTVFWARGGQSGGIELNDTSEFTHVDGGITSGDITAAAGASTTEFVGVSPRMEIPSALVLGEPVPFTVTGDPGDAWIAYVANDTGWFDGFSTIGFPEMVSLLDLSANWRPYRSGLFPGGGSETFDAGQPSDASLIGLTFPLQILAADLGSFTLRFGNLREITFLP